MWVGGGWGVGGEGVCPLPARIEHRKGRGEAFEPAMGSRRARLAGARLAVARRVHPPPSSSSHATTTSKWLLQRQTEEAGHAEGMGRQAGPAASLGNKTLHRLLQLAQQRPGQGQLQLSWLAPTGGGLSQGAMPPHWRAFELWYHAAPLAGSFAREPAGCLLLLLPLPEARPRLTGLQAPPSWPPSAPARSSSCPAAPAVEVGWDGVGAQGMARSRNRGFPMQRAGAC